MSDDEIVEADVIGEHDPFSPSDRKRKPKWGMSEYLWAGCAVIGEVYKRFPYGSMLALLILALGFGILFGLLDISTAGIGLVLGVVFLIASYQFREITKAGPLGTLVMIALVFFFQYAKQTENDYQKQVKVSPTYPIQDARETRAVMVEKFWHQTIVSQHVSRFGPPDQLSFEDSDSLRRFYTEQLADVQRTESIVQNSDIEAIELKNLSQRLIALDKRELGLIARLLGVLGLRNRPLSQQPVEGALIKLDELIDEEWDQLPREQQQWIADYYEVQEAKQILLSEVETIQEQLRERYPTKGFPLPNISTEIGN